jgi:hypothetical protein
MAGQYVIPLAIAATLGADCADSDILNCDDVGYSAVVVELRDAMTDLPPDPQEFVGVARDGEFTDSIVRVTTVFTFALERPGTYDITIAGEGFEVWTAKDVRVTKGACHVNTVRLVARLQPTGRGSS